MTPHLNQWYEFLVSHNIKVSVSFELLWHKCAIATSELSIAACFKSRLSDGLDQLFVRMVDGNVLDLHVDTWVRSIMLQRLAHELEQADVQDFEEKRAQTYLQQFEGLLAMLPDLASAQKLQSNMADIKVFITMFKAVLRSADVLPSQANAAKKHLMSPEFAQLKLFFQKAVVGVECMTALDDLMQRGVSDELADTTFSEALKAVSDPTMTGLSTDKDEHGDEVLVGGMLAIKNVSAVHKVDTMLFSMLTDMLHQMLEAKKLWSSVRFEERSGDIGTIYAKVRQLVVCLDTVLADSMAQTIMPKTEELRKAPSQIRVKLGHLLRSQRSTRGIVRCLVALPTVCAARWYT